MDPNACRKVVLDLVSQNEVLRQERDGLAKALRDVLEEVGNLARERDALRDTMKVAVQVLSANFALSNQHPQNGVVQHQLPPAP